MIKQILKQMMGYIRAFVNKIRVPRGGKIYIGKDVNILGGKNIVLGNDVTIRPHSVIWCNSGTIKINNGTEIGERDRISIANELLLGEKVLLAPNVYITDCDHAYQDVEKAIIEQGIVNEANRVYIGDHSYIGINSVIVGNVRIGKHCVIGANSVVLSNIEDYTVAAGIPARPIKKYNFET